MELLILGFVLGFAVSRIKNIDYWAPLTFTLLIYTLMFVGIPIAFIMTLWANWPF